MFKPEPLLVTLLRSPEKVTALDTAQWNDLIPQARRTGLLGRLKIVLEQAALLDDLPLQPKQHLLSISKVVDKHSRALSWELKKLQQAFSSLETPVILLKGAAYYARQLDHSQGRLFSDIDLLVPQEKINFVEQSLMSGGWFGVKQDSYDQRYYREWMHEIPPLRHMSRGTALDVHHTILPPTAKYKPDPAKLMAAAQEISPGIYTLSPVDMVIHSATHLFHEGDFDHGLRDILDLHGLLNHFGESEPGFWDALVPRAIELDLINPLYYALHYCSLILGTNIPQAVLKQAEKGKPNVLLSRVMDWLFMRALRPDHPSCDLPFTGIARWLLYIRSHYLRMPLHLLIPHLVRKAWKRQFVEAVEQASPDQALNMPKPKSDRWRFWAK